MNADTPSRLQANLFAIDDYNKIHATNNYVVTPIKGTKDQYRFV